MLAAAEALANGTDPTAWKKRVVFMALVGEPWGYMGSKRLLWELAIGGNGTQGLQLEDIEQVGPHGGPLSLL